MMRRSSLSNRRSLGHPLLQLSFAFLLGFICAVGISYMKETNMIKFGGSFDAMINVSLAAINGKTNLANVQPWHDFIAINKSSKTESSQGNKGGAWNWCGHVVQYGPNFDRGYISFIANILQPDSALEFGAGIGLYINTLFKYRAEKKDPNSHGYFVGIEPESMLDAKIYKELPPVTVNTITSPANSEISDDVFSTSLKSQALQLAIDIYNTSQDVLDSIPMFDVVYTSEVLEHIPAKYHNQTLDFLVSKTKKFLVFGAARPGQGGKGHLGESMKHISYWIERLRDERGMILLQHLTKRLSQSCYNTWDKGQNSFIVANPDYYKHLENEMKELHIKGDNLDKMLADQTNVYDLYPEFQKSVVEIQSNKSECVSGSNSQSRRALLMAHV